MSEASWMQRHIEEQDWPSPIEEANESLRAERDALVAERDKWIDRDYGDCMQKEEAYLRIAELEGQLATLEDKLTEVEASRDSFKNINNFLIEKAEKKNATEARRAERHERQLREALRQLRNFRDGLSGARKLYAEKSGKPDRFTEGMNLWWQEPDDQCVVLWLIEWAEDVQCDLIDQLGKERDALAAENERLRAAEGTVES